MDAQNFQNILKHLSREPNGPTQIKKRSVLIAGHRTSISLENLFWDSLKMTAQRQGKSINQLVTEIDRTRTGNLSSALRTFVLLTHIPVDEWEH